MNKIISLSILLFLLCTPIYAQETVDSSVNQCVQNDNTYLGINFEKQPANKEGRQLITNHKSFLIINIVNNGKLIPEKQTEQSGNNN